MQPSFQESNFPPVRQFTADIGKLSSEQHTIRAFLEVDVTDALQQIKALRSPTHKVSFLAWFIKVLADTIVDHPPINGLKKGRNRVIVFHQVDVSTIVERKVHQVAVPLPLVLRAVNTKSPFEVTREIQNAVDQSLENQNAPQVGSGENSLLIKLGLILPQWLRLIIMRKFILGNPQRMQATMGTVMVTSLGTVGQVPGWIMPTSIHPLSVGIGSLTKKPSVVRGKIQPRQILHLTVGMDHDIIDGMPARAFIADLLDRLTRGHALAEVETHKP